MCDTLWSACVEKVCESVLASARRTGGPAVAYWRGVRVRHGGVVDDCTTDVVADDAGPVEPEASRHWTIFIVPDA